MLDESPLVPLDKRRVAGGRGGAEKTDRGRCRLLRARRKWQRRCRAAEKRDEVAALQLIELHSIPASQGRRQDIELAASSQRVSEWLYNLYQPSTLAPIVEMSEFSKSGKFDKSGRDSVAATLKLVHSARHQHCKYDRNENKRGHISDQMTALGRIAEGLYAHDRPMNHARPHGEPDEALVSVGIS